MVRSIRTGPRRAAVVALAATLLAITGCSGDDEPGEADPSPTPTPSGPPPVETKATIGAVSGKFPDAERERLKAKVKTVVDDWLDAAYLAGDYSRADFADAFPHFSARAAREAGRDARLMSNQKLGGRVESVAATKRQLRIDVLAVNKKAVGVTARFELTMDLAGVNRSERVSGRLFLSRREGSWQVFGYDVKRGRA
jgi:hypothetical protein